eukprot:TRINITY_DN435_c8_g1_i1.p1 TRINITY_DN435_c8_g1~~TRINITY_DN435_c8_g1_i1.p1  ORF type:complete len:1012 (+),score=248.93 TRINITY_DN435_c8_g1_i1:197-3232(+)
MCCLPWPSTARMCSTALNSIIWNSLCRYPGMTSRTPATSQGCPNPGCTRFCGSSKCPPRAGRSRAAVMAPRRALSVRRQFLIRCLFVLCALACLTAASTAWAAKETWAPKQVLLLNSYHVGYRWNVKLLEGMHDVLNRSDIPLRLRYEFMDAKHYASDAFVGELRSLYRQKYGDIDFDVIIASDNDAFNFLRRYRDEIFPGAPVVFCGVNNFQPSWLDDFPKVTGIGEYFDLEGTMELALDLVPSAKHMVVVGGVDTSSRMNHQMVVDLMPRFEDRVDFIDLYGLNPDELAERLQNVPEDSVLLYLAYYLTPNGTRLTVQESISFIAEQSGLPMFSAWSYTLLDGMVGGKMLMAEEQGRMAAELAMRILHGEPVEDIPVISSAPTHYMFDYNMLRKYGIGLDKLPEDSVILNLDQSFFERHQLLVLAVLAFIIYQSVFIVGLLLNNRRRRRAEAGLRRKEAQLEIQLELSRMTAVPLDEFLDHALARIVTHMASRAGFLYLALHQTGEVHAVALVAGKIRHARNDEVHALIDQSVVNSLQQQGPAHGEGDVGGLWKNLTGTVRNHAVVSEGLEGRASLLMAVADRPQGFRDATVQDLSLYCREILRLTRLRLDEALRSQLEDQLLHSQKLEALGTFTGSIAHDFNNILESIASCCELALDEIPAQLATPRSDLLQALRSSRRGKTLIRRLLDFSRREPSRTQPVSLSQLAEECLDMIQPLLPAGISADAHIEETPLVMGDPDKLALAIINLLTNSIRAMGEYGKLQLRVAYRAEGASGHGVEDEAGHVVLEVRDSGCGMPQDVLDHIFEPFFTTRPKGEGTGLGLSVVDGIVRSHNGAISVESAPGQGTAFTMQLPPASSSELEGQPRAAEDLPAGGDEYLMVVDDDYDVGRVLARKLERLGYAVTLAGSGAEALEHYGDGGLISLVITDYDMPEMNGMEFARALQQITPGLPVVMISGHDIEAIQENTGEMLAAGVRAVMHKPVDHNRLARSIRALLDNTLPDPGDTSSR